MLPVAAAIPARRALLVTDLVDSTRLVARLGDKRSSALFAQHDRVARDLLQLHGGREIDKTDGFLMLFDRVPEAVGYTLAYHRALASLGAEVGIDLVARAGVHEAEVLLRENPPEDVARGAKPVEVEGIAKPIAARVMALAAGRQTLLTRAAFDAARDGGVREAVGLRWLAHGTFNLKGLDEPVEVFEVGEEGLAPLSAPASSEKAQRAHDDLTIVGWRPAPGQLVPRREGFMLERRLGAGGFGEVWLARKSDTDERVVFKFCFEVERLRALRREAALFRLLMQALPDRDDVARLLDYSFDESPYFIEIEHAEGGSLIDWAAKRGGIGSVPMEVRLEILAQAAEATAAAHSVGVLHKDLKPANLLVASAEGPPRIRLTDFGIGMVTEAAHPEQFGLTVTTLARVDSSSSSGSGGTPRYMAPEILEGKTSSIQADVYALGVILYQLVAGDFRRALAQGWERDVPDEILREDIAASIDGLPERRLASAAELATRLRGLASRHAGRDAERRASLAAERARRRRRIAVPLVVGLAAFALLMAVQARRIAKEAERANREASAAREVTRFMTELFQLTESARGQGETVTARELLDKGAERVRKELRAEPLTQARMLDAIGLAYLKLGLLERAAPLIEEALDVRRRLLGNEHPEVASSLDSQGLLLLRQKKYAEAEAKLGLALGIRKRALGERHPDVATVMEHLADLYKEQGRYDAARPLLEKAARIARASGEPSATAAGSVERPRREVVEVVREVDLPADAVALIGNAPDPRTVLVAGAQGIYFVDLEGKAAPSHYPLAAGERVVRGLYPGTVAIRSGSRILRRQYLGEENQILESVLFEGIADDDRIALDPGGDVLLRVAGTEISAYLPPAKRPIVRRRLSDKPGPIAVSRRFAAWIDSGHTLHVLSLLTGEELLARHDWEGQVGAIAIDDPSGRIAVGGWFDEVLVYAIDAGGAPRRYALSGKTQGLMFLSDRPTLVVGKVGRIAFLQDEDRPVAEIESAAAVFEDLGWGGAGVLAMDQVHRKLLALAYRAANVDARGAVSGAALWAMAADRDLESIVLGAEDGRLQRYDPATGRLVTRVAHTQGVTSVVVVYGKAVTASDDKTIAVWDARTLENVGRSKAHEYLVNNLYWEDATQTLWSSSSDGSIKGWGLPALVEKESIDAGRVSKSALWVDSARGLGLAGTWDGSVIELRKQGGCFSVARTQPVRSNGIYAIAELPAVGAVALCGVRPGTAFVYDIEAQSFSEILTPDPMLGWVTAIAPDRLLLCGGNIVASYRFVRDGRALRYEVAMGINTDLGELGVATALPWNGMAAVGSGTGEISILDPHAIFTTSLGPRTVGDMPWAGGRWRSGSGS